VRGGKNSQSASYLKASAFRLGAPVRIIDEQTAGM
jgi:hypothetical protein